MKIVVLGGGSSPEREVSLRSAEAVAAAARAAGFTVTTIDPSKGLDQLNNYGKDYIILPILHGVGGEDGKIQSALEARDLAYLGSDSKSSAGCFDKLVTKQRFDETAIPTPNYELVTKDTYKQSPLAHRPHVLKVRRGGSSIGTLIVRDLESINKDEIEKLFKLDTEAIIEELIKGPEVTIPALDGKALPVIEIVPPEGREFDYENKYNGLAEELCPPKSISTEVQKRVHLLAEKVHKVMGCRHLSRIDIMLDKAGNPFVLEINTMPGLTGQSLYPKSAAVFGLDMPALVKKFIDLVKRDYNL